MQHQPDDRTRWNARHAQRAAEGPAAPSVAVLSLASHLPQRGRALDLAGGTGRHALWLVQRGLDVTLLDVSDVALEVASEHAARRSVSLSTLRWDLSTGMPGGGPWDVVLCVNFLDRAVYSQLGAKLAPGGCAIVVHPTRTNLERHARPSSRYLLEPGELPGLMGELSIAVHREGWLDGEHHLAAVVASASGSPRRRGRRVPRGS
ncbi:MAG: class I SAM-dependent methyltransferase [Myxococcales bacterium]|nr:class I SAM-dependent methyltransferase [Myxococcales bacterium]MDD9964771.1 class I SAM-dependent methyltransferase [Myxococcales bacterium]